MPKLAKKRSKKSGLPPGALVHIGEKKTDEIKITVTEFDETQFNQWEAKSFDECIPYRNKSTVTWINVDGIHHVDTLAKLGECFGLHPLVMEDILTTDQRPKMEDYDDYLYVVLRMLFCSDDQASEVLTEQISLILGPNFVLSFQEKESNLFDPIIERMKNTKGRARKMGADYLTYALVDSIVDSYFVILERLGERIEFLEERLVLQPTPATLQLIHNLKREMIFLRKSVWPLREVISRLERGGSALIQESTMVYLRDIYDHTIQVIDTIETYRDILSGMLDIYLSSISNRMNAVMKVLTIIATIFMPLTFIAGVYGMNFKYMPELEWHWGYPLIWLIMVMIALSMLLYFKNKKWL
jgi:magnesium transporter